MASFHRLGDKGSDLDDQLRDLMPPDYQRAINGINNKSDFLNLPEPVYNIVWRKSGQKKTLDRKNNIFVDLWIPQ